MKLTVASILLILTLVPAAVASGQSLEQINQVERIDKAMDALNQLSATFDTMSRTRRTDCLKAFGSEAFCSCIGDKLAVAWSFSDYIAITTRAKEANGYDKLESELKVAYDKVGPIRDECVAASVAP
jgi:hypothetical protein